MLAPLGHRARTGPALGHLRAVLLNPANVQVIGQQGKLAQEGTIKF